MSKTHHGVRFAPSPTGRFHLGNLRTAWISREWARALGLPWVLRFEDIDQPRVRAGAQQAQLSDMRQLGLESDEILVQSEFHDRHWKLFQRARDVGRVYPCNCSRKDLLEALHGMASAPHRETPLYHGKCRALAAQEVLRAATSHPTIAWRFRSDDPSGQDDFIAARTPSGMSRLTERDFVPSYHWACAIDDYDGGYELLVRAADLRGAVLPQRVIHRWLREVEGATRPFVAVFHASVVTGEAGQRLEKRTRGITLPELLAAGWSPERILELFSRSFHAEASLFSPERIWGERKDSVSLLELGFTQEK